MVFCKPNQNRLRMIEEATDILVSVGIEEKDAYQKVLEAMSQCKRGNLEEIVNKALRL